MWALCYAMFYICSFCLLLFVTFAFLHLPLLLCLLCFWHNALQLLCISEPIVYLFAKTRYLFVA